MLQICLWFEIWLRLNVSILRRLKARLYFHVQSSVSRSWVVSTIRDSSVFGFYFGSILVISSGHCCVDFFRVVFGVWGFTCGSLLFLSFVFVRGALHGFVGCGMVIFNSSVTRLRLTFAVSFLFLFLF